jgi:glyoxylase-like metal-dependent hydrolase (beta-lactamase superfamily II)
MVEKFRMDWKSCIACAASASVIPNAVACGSLRIDWILDTHAHADHLSGADYLRRRIEDAFSFDPDVHIVPIQGHELRGASDDYMTKEEGE